MEDKKKKKPKSLLIKLKEAKEEIERIEDISFKRCSRIRKLESRIEFLENLVPEKFYRIKFKIKAGDKNIYSYEKIIKGYSPQNAIDRHNEDLIYPDTFEILDIALLA